MFPYRISAKDIHPLQKVIALVFQLLLMSSHCHVISGDYCSNALALAYSIQPTACNNIPQCLPNCAPSFYSASTACSSSITYCNPEGNVCGYYVTGGAYSDEGYVGSLVTISQSWTVYFTKGFDGVKVTLYKTPFGSELSINDKKCAVSIGSCDDRLYIDCTKLNHGWVDFCTGEYSKGSALEYFFSLDAIDPCNNNNVPTTPAPTPRTLAPVAATPPTLPAPPTSSTLPAPINSPTLLAAPTSSTIPAPTPPMLPVATPPTLTAPTSPTFPAPISPTVPAPILPTVPAPKSPTVPAPISPTVPAPISPTVPAPKLPTVPAPTLPSSTSPTFTAPTSPNLPAPNSPPIPAPTSPTMPAPITPPSTNPNESQASCFSSSNTVVVKDVGPIPIDQLQIGDMVQSDHSGTYTQVYGFGHYDRSSETDYIQLFMKDNDIENEGLEPLEISSFHYIFIRSRANDNSKNKNEKEMLHINDMITIRALDVIVGDQIWNGQQYQTIQSILYVKRHGIYAPLTQSGNLIVSNVMVSNYVHLLNDHVNSFLLWNQHDLGHIFFFPLRYYCQHNINDCRKETYYNGYSYWAYYIVHISSHMNQYSWFGALLISLMTIPMFLIATIIETSVILFGLLLLCFAIFLIVHMRKMSRSY